MVGIDFSKSRLIAHSSSVGSVVDFFLCIQTVLMLMFMLFFSWTLCAGEFTASVNRHQIHLGEQVVLTLSLKEVSAKSSPAVQALNTSFVITSQQQTSNTVIRNGQASSTIGWKLTLTPKREGELQIPSITVATSEGVLSSQPITIQVNAATASKSTEPSVAALTLRSEVSNSKPYKQEPVFYTVKLTTQRNIANVKIQKIELENAIVEVNGDPQSYETTLNGTPAGVIEFSYRIIPLKAGPLKIPSVLVQGVMPMQKKAHALSGFDDDDFSPFALFGGFDLMQPFVQMTDEISLEVLPSIPDIQPWIPAKSLKLEELWNESTPLRVGEPVNRSLKITAEGVTSGQLPSLADLQQEGNAFKIYADKPELNDEVKGKTIKSERLENYTVIPQQAGTVTLPEITIVWWNVGTKEKMVAQLPARIIQVQPAAVVQQQVIIPPSVSEKAVVSAPPQDHSKTEASFLFYALIALAGLLFATLVWGIVLRCKMRRLENESIHQKSPKAHERPDKAIEKKSKKEKLPDLNPT